MLLVEETVGLILMMSLYPHLTLASTVDTSCLVAKSKKGRKLQFFYGQLKIFDKKDYGCSKV